MLGRAEAIWVLFGSNLHWLSLLCPIGWQAGKGFTVELAFLVSLSKRKRIQTAYVLLNFLQPCLKKETGENDFNGIFYLPQHIQDISFQHAIDIKLFFMRHFKFFFFFSISLCGV